MTSRKDYRKKNTQGSKYLIIAGVAVIVLACAGIWGHNAYQQHQATVLAENKKQVAYNKKHFNANVTIYGVKVGKLTVDQAVEKIQAKAVNKLVYKDGKISAVRDSKLTTISKEQVQKYFDKQYTQLPTDQSYNYENTSLKKGKSKLKAITAASVDYSVAGKTFTLAAKDYLTQVSYYSGAVHYDDASKLTAETERHGQGSQDFGQELQVQDSQPGQPSPLPTRATAGGSGGGQRQEGGSVSL